MSELCWQCGQEIIIFEDKNIYLIKCGCGVRAFYISLYEPKEVNK